MANDIYMVITDQSDATLVGESQQSVYDPYLERNVKNPVLLRGFDGDTQNAITLGSTGGGAGKIVFNPFSVSKTVDRISQALFLAEALGTAFKYVDVLVVRAGGTATSVVKPYLSYRLGTVLVSEISTSIEEESNESVSFVFGQLQIGYQVTNANGSLQPFQPVGWDRLRNIRM